jgi:hypothetical protein
MVARCTSFLLGTTAFLWFIGTGFSLRLAAFMGTVAGNAAAAGGPAVLFVLSLVPFAAVGVVIGLFIRHLRGAL